MERRKRRRESKDNKSMLKILQKKTLGQQFSKGPVYYPRDVIVMFLHEQHMIRPFGEEFQVDDFVGSFDSSPNVHLQQYLRAISNLVSTLSSVSDNLKDAIRAYLGPTPGSSLESSPEQTPPGSEAGYDGDNSS